MPNASIGRQQRVERISFDTVQYYEAPTDRSRFDYTLACKRMAYVSGRINDEAVTPKDYRYTEV